MANYSELLNDINAAIYENNDQEIDALEVRAILREMVASLGSGFLFKGIATPSSPGTSQAPDQNVFYLATTAGTYTYLGGLVVAAGEVAFLCYDGTWTKKSSALLSTGSIVDNTTTEDATKPLSAKQGKVLADAGAATAAEVTALGQEVGEINGALKGASNAASYTTIPGYSIYNTTKSANANYSISSPIHLAIGDSISGRFVNNGGNAISLTNADGTSFSRLVAGASDNSPHDFSYTAGEDCYVCICWRSATASPEWVDIYSSEVLTNILQQLFDLNIIGEVLPQPATTTLTGKAINTSGELVDASAYKVVGPILLDEGQSVILKTTASLASVISVTDDELDSFTPVSVVSAESTAFYTYTAEAPTYVALCGRISDFTWWLGDFNFATKDIIQNVEQGADAQKYLRSSVYEATYSVISGRDINGYSERANANYSHSSPIHLNKGDVIRCSVVNVGANAISLTNASGTMFAPLVIGGSSTRYDEYVYSAESDCYVAICWRSASGSPQYIDVYSSETITEVLKNIVPGVGLDYALEAAQQENFGPTPGIKAFKRLKGLYMPTESSQK